MKVDITFELNVVEETGWGWLPAIALFDYDAGCVVNPESLVGKVFIAQDSAGAGCLAFLMGLLVL